MMTNDAQFKPEDRQKLVWQMFILRLHTFFKLLFFITCLYYNYLIFIKRRFIKNGK